MVSNVLEVDQDDLVKQLKTFKKKYAEDAEYKKLRATLLRVEPRTPWPAASTIGELLHREALSEPRIKPANNELAQMGGKRCEASLFF